MNLTANEKRIVLAVFTELLKKPYKELNSFLGSLTIYQMQELASKLRYEGYCERHGIRYEDMTDDDFAMASEEENAS
jgi:hypothetical protein